MSLLSEIFSSSDLELKTNVAKVCKPMSYVMFVGVRLFGWYYWDKFEKQREK